MVAPPQPHRDTVQVKAVRPECDHLKIRFPQVEGYRVELPEERLTAAFNDDSVLKARVEDEFDKMIGASLEDDTTLIRRTRI